MTPDIEDHQEIRRYLLGNLSGEDQQRVEERLLTEQGVFEELLFAEEELIDDYVTDDLSDEDRTKFEQHFLSTPERHQRLRFAMTLSRYAANSPEKVSMAEASINDAKERSLGPAADPTWAERFRAFGNSQTWVARVGVASLVTVVVIAGAWWWLLRPPTPQNFATITLTITAGDRAQGAQPVKIKVPPASTALKISLQLPDGMSAAAGYRVELLDNNGETKSVEIAGRDAQSVSVIIPAAQLTRGQYALRLYITKADGREERIPGSYLFTLE